MYSHPLLEALFNADASTPSKQLQQARNTLAQCTDNPSILILLPPASVIASTIDMETLYQDTFMLSHVLDARNLNKQVLTTLNGTGWQVQVTSTEVIPLNGFPVQRSNTVKIQNSYLWMPGHPHYQYNATFMVLEVDNVLLANDSSKRMSWFGPGRSIPLTQPVESMMQPAVAPEPQYGPVARVSPDLVPVDRRKVHNPALNLEINVIQQEKAVARVDYCIACLQQNVASSQELASRFHVTVQNVKTTLEEFGGVFNDTDGDDQAGSDSYARKNTFTLVEIYDYAEIRLGRTLLRQLDEFLDSEREVAPFYEIFRTTTHLDITQVDIPGLGEGLNITAFEQATIEAALVLGHLGEATLSTDMCRTFLRAMSYLVDPKLGTVSADTLLGLFMLTILRTSADAVQVLERDVYFVTNFSFQASNNILARASAGRLSYTLMVVESVMLHVRAEHQRLSHLSLWNTKMWHAVRGDDRAAIREVMEVSPSSVVSRRYCKSALFMAVEDKNTSLLQFLLSELSDQFSREFVLHDRDMKRRTLLMAVFDSAGDDLSMARIILDVVGDDPEYLRQLDMDSRHIGYYAKSPVQIKFITELPLAWSSRDKNQETAVVYQAKHNFTRLHMFLDLVSNFYEHIDATGDSLLHFTAQNAELVQKVLGIPGCNVNWSNANGMSALFVSKSEEVCNILLANGADPWLYWVPHLGSMLTPAVPPPPTGSLTPTGLPMPPVCTARAALVGCKAVYVDNGTMPGMKLVAGKSVSASDLAKLSSELTNISPTSWIPTLQLHEPTPIGQLFFTDLNFGNIIRLSSWFNQLNWHATLSTTQQLQEFYSHPKEVQSGEIEATDCPTASLFGSEDESSMLMFLKLGSERLNSLHSALAGIVRQMSRLRIVAEELNSMETKANLSLSLHSSLTDAIVASNELKNSSIKRNTASKPLHVSAAKFYTEKIHILTVMELSKHAQNLQLRLDQSLDLAITLRGTRRTLSRDREQLQSLASAKPKPAWLSSLETKRVAEMETMEQSVSKSKKQVAEMELELRATHYCLANELGSFNSCQKEEVLHQIRAYSLQQLQKAKDSLSILQHGYLPTH